MATIAVRMAELSDADDMGRVHVEAWQAAYRRIMPDEFLDELRPADRAKDWRAALERNPDPPEGRRLVVELDGSVVGMALVWPARGEDEGGLGELIMINLAPTAWGTGAGTELFETCEDELRRLGFAEVVLWVAEANARARRFYERQGWTADGSAKTDEIGGAPITEVRYRKVF